MKGCIRGGRAPEFSTVRRLPTRSIISRRLILAMGPIYQLVVALAALSSSAAAQSCATISPAYAPTWGSGFSGHVVMNGLKTPRGMVFDSQNNLLVVESGGAGVRYIKLTDNGGMNVCVTSSKQIIPERGVSKHK
jgi:glucose/arabinose dehydrogenase